MDFIIEHTKLGFSVWDLPALIVLVAIIVLFIVRHHNMKKKRNELEDTVKGFSSETSKEINNT